MSEDAGDRAGLAIIHKKPDITSFQTLGAIKNALGLKRVGHTGTLDRVAEGVLIVLSGWCTRLAPWFLTLDKTYQATIRFGLETDTLDPEGKEVATGPIPSEKLMRETIDAFRGEIEQIPPSYSAIHINGVRAHKLARSGQAVTPEKRKVFVHEIDVLSIDGADCVVKVRCSKGTYIRTLARDIGLACNSRAYLTNLVRTAVGEFSLEDAVDPQKFSPQDIIQIEEALGFIRSISKIDIQDNATSKILHGGALSPEDFQSSIISDGLYWAADSSGHLLAIFEKTGSSLQYRMVRPATL